MVTVVFEDLKQTAGGGGLNSLETVCIDVKMMLLLLFNVMFVCSPNLSSFVRKCFQLKMICSPQPSS